MVFERRSVRRPRRIVLAVSAADKLQAGKSRVALLEDVVHARLAADQLGPLGPRVVGIDAVEAYDLLQEQDGLVPVGIDGRAELSRDPAHFRHGP